MVKELKKVSVDLKQYTDNVFKKVLTLKLFAIWYVYNESFNTNKKERGGGAYSCFKTNNEYWAQLKTFIPITIEQNETTLYN